MNDKLIERAEDLAARCIPPAAGIIREMVAMIEDKQREIDSIRALCGIKEATKPCLVQHAETP